MCVYTRCILEVRRLVRADVRFLMAYLSCSYFSFSFFSSLAPAPWLAQSPTPCGESWASGALRPPPLFSLARPLIRAFS